MVALLDDEEEFKSVPWMINGRLATEEEVDATYQMFVYKRFEKDSNGKIDHPPNGSKDAIDGVCGALYNASQHAEEFSFEWGETIQTTIDISSAGNEFDRKQIVLNFEEELKKLDPVLNAESAFIDFGMGKAQDLYSNYLVNGIIL